MADSVYYVNKLSLGGDGSGGIDVLTGPTAAFSSLEVAESALDNTINAGDVVTIKGKGTDSTPDGYAFFNGWTINGQLIIESDESSRHNGVWNPDAYTIGDATEAYALRLAETNVTVRHIQFDRLSPSDQDMIYLAFGNNNINIYGNIFRSVVNYGNLYSVLRCSHSGMSVNLDRNIVIGFKFLIRDSSGSGALISADGNTVVDVQRLYEQTKANKPLLYDNAIYNSDDGITGTVDSLSNYNATNSSTFGAGYTTNTNDLVNQAIEFVDADNEDYRIVASSPLKTAGENGDQIGAFYEEGSGGESVTSDVTIEIGSPTFISSSTATLPQPSADITFNTNSVTFSILSDVTLPNPVSNVNMLLLQPVFNIDGNVTSPNPVSTVNISLQQPTFTLTSNVTLPSPIGDTSFTLSPPSFSSGVYVTLPNPTSSIDWLMSVPVFNVESNVTEPVNTVNSDVSFTVDGVLFNAVSGVTLPQPVSNITLSIQQPTFKLKAQLSGVDIVIPNYGATIVYNPGSNYLKYSVGSNALEYSPGSNTLIY